METIMHSSLEATTTSTLCSWCRTGKYEQSNFIELDKYNQNMNKLISQSWKHALLLTQVDECPLFDLSESQTLQGLQYAALWWAVSPWIVRHAGYIVEVSHGHMMSSWSSWDYDSVGACITSSLNLIDFLKGREIVQKLSPHYRFYEFLTLLFHCSITQT